jgi:hypothetical protein
MFLDLPTVGLTSAWRGSRELWRFAARATVRHLPALDRGQVFCVSPNNHEDSRTQRFWWLSPRLNDFADFEARPAFMCVYLCVVAWGNVVAAAGFETASCAVTILVIKRIALNAIGILFMKVVCRFVFKVLVIGCGVRIYSNASRKGRICTNATENQAKRPNDLLRARRG